jgi:acid phosphatase family membrane protein YuiD
MSTNGVSPESPGQTEAPSVVRRLEGESAAELGDLVETFEELQTVLRCCERLMTEVAGRPHPDEVVVEGVWTMALLSYARSFAERRPRATLSEQDLTTAQPETEVLKWHEILLQLRDQHANPGASPRERFTIAVTQGDDGAASGVAITSARQPLVDEVTVRQTGAIAYALSELVNERIESQQLVVFEELKEASRADLEKLETVELAPANG